MPFLPSPKFQWFAAISVLALLLCSGSSAFARSGDGAVQTYTNQAVPPQLPSQYDRYNSPLKAGELTLEDVLKAHPNKKATATTAPMLEPSSRSSATNLMLMQGMQSALQQSGSGGPVHLHAPQLGGGGVAGKPAAGAASALPMPINVGPAPGVVYQPGQAPINLATGKPQSLTSSPVSTISTSPASTVTGVQTVTSTTVNAAVPPAAPAPTPISSVQPSPGGCVEHTQTWTKTCVEAGYPANFTGKITGETRTSCPDGGLHDVWIANSCAPPGEGASAYAPEPGTAPSSSTQQVISTATSQSSMAATAAAPPPVPAAAAPSVVSHAPAFGPTDASCGAANGLATNAKPESDLCVAGNPTGVDGDGPWRWTCKGIDGGMTVSCAAPVAPKSAASEAAPLKATAMPSPEDGVCGAADGVSTDHMPASGLCAHGVASSVNGKGPWTWACSGLNGGQAAACTAPRKMDGVCGSATSTPTDQMPMNNLCAAGYASAVTGNGPWNWTCSGLYGGTAAMCSAAPKRDAVCGGASLTGHRQTPSDNLCSVGTPSEVHGGGPWNWNCNGVNGGSSVSCNAPISVNGVCGEANGVAVTGTPSDHLCLNGTPTRVTGTGPWMWNCAGSDGGNTQSCTAPVLSRAERAEEAEAATAPPPAAAPTAASHSASETLSFAAPAKTSAAVISRASSSSSLCGGAADLMALAAPEADLCKTGKASAVSGSGPWTWTCTDKGRSSNCSTLSPAGTAAAAPATAPSEQPPAAAKAHAAVEAPAPEAALETPAVNENTASCGASAGEGTKRAPAIELCNIGKPTRVSGKGPWHWMCVKGKSKVKCEAPLIVDGACGIANGSIQKYAPTRGLCSSGVPTQVQGEGPWLWTCVGAGGGISTSCSATSQAQTRVDGACGVAANAPAAAIPTVNLCDSGVPSAVYGDGPWTWTCSGINGGIAVSCASQKNVPAAPPPPAPAVNGLCGSANGQAAVTQPTEGLCSAGTATATSGEGPWNWNCLGINGGMTVSCTAPLQPPAPITGACGNASGVPTLTRPVSGLCSAGISSAVSGNGPWTWSCSGTNGGGAVGCVAPVAGRETGGLPSVTTAGGEAPVPRASPAGRVTSAVLATPKLPSGPLPPLAPSGTMPPSPGFGAMPQPSAVPPVPTPEEEATPSEPGLPAGAAPLEPPSLRNLKNSPALMKNDLKNSIPGNHFTLDEDISTISFDHGSGNISPDALPTLDKLAAVLLDHSGARITLTAYADNSGISAREARRLSLNRALAVRDYLVAKGIPSGRIDVRALGANFSSGEPDRVDVKVN